MHIILIWDEPKYSCCINHIKYDFRICKDYTYGTKAIYNAKENNIVSAIFIWREKKIIAVHKGNTNINNNKHPKVN